MRVGSAQLLSRMINAKWKNGSYRDGSQQSRYLTASLPSNMPQRCATGSGPRRRLPERHEPPTALSKLNGRL